MCWRFSGKEEIKQESYRFYEIRLKRDIKIQSSRLKAVDVKFKKFQYPNLKIEKKNWKFRPKDAKIQTQKLEGSNVKLFNLWLFVQTLTIALTVASDKQTTGVLPNVETKLEISAVWRDLMFKFKFRNRARDRFTLRETASRLENCFAAKGQRLRYCQQNPRRCNTIVHLHMYQPYEYVSTFLKKLFSMWERTVDITKRS